MHINTNTILNIIWSKVEDEWTISYCIFHFHETAPVKPGVNIFLAKPKKIHLLVLRLIIIYIFITTCIPSGNKHVYNTVTRSRTPHVFQLFEIGCCRSFYVYPYHHASPCEISIRHFIANTWRWIRLSLTLCILHRRDTYSHIRYWQFVPDRRCSDKIIQNITYTDVIENSSENSLLHYRLNSKRILLFYQLTDLFIGFTQHTL